MSIQSEERDLWLAVLGAVITDLESTSHASKPQRDDAISWVGTFPSRDFRTVCSLAGIEPDAVHWRLRRIIESRHPTTAKKKKKEFPDEEDFNRIGSIGARSLAACAGGYATAQHF